MYLLAKAREHQLAWLYHGAGKKVITGVLLRKKRVKATAAPPKNTYTV